MPLGFVKRKKGFNHGSCCIDLVFTVTIMKHPVSKTVPHRSELIQQENSAPFILFDINLFVWNGNIGWP